MSLTRFARTATPIVALLAILVAVPWSAADERAGGKRSEDQSLFSTAQYLEHVGYLASDELEGRSPGQPGIDQAAEYIAAWFKTCGVQPAGDNGTYFQNFTLKLGYEVGTDTRLSIGVQGRTARRPAKLNEDFVPLPFSKAGSFKGEVVFAGYGIVSDDVGYDDYAGIDATDKVVLVLRRSPKFADFSDRDQSFRGKATRANARDAAAMLIVNPVGDADGDTFYNFKDSSPGFSGFGRQSYGMPMMQVSRETANRMLEAAGLLDLAALQQQIEETRRSASRPLAGVTVRGEVDIQPVQTPVRNVVGLIPGTGNQSEEIIALGAHYDHIGIQNKGEPTFDPQRDIFNGADDNASGTALVMTMARAYTQGPKPNRSILLMAFTAEELGLLGSRHYARNPTVDLSKCVAMFNFDMVGRLKNNRLEVGGMRTADFEGMVKRLAEPYGLQIRDGGGGSGPSDHTNFYAKKIPVLFFFTGLHPQYHQSTDDAERINSEGAMLVGRLVADCIDEIDAMETAPKFHGDRRGAKLFTQGDSKDQEPEAKQPEPPTPPEPPTAPQPLPRPRVRLGITPRPNDQPGILVDKVEPQSAAARGGLEPGDRIIRVGHEEVRSIRDLLQSLMKYKESDKAVIVIRRGEEEEEKKLEVRFGAAPKDEATAAAMAEIMEQLSAAMAELVGEEGEITSTIKADSGNSSVELTITSTAWRKQGPEALPAELLGLLQEALKRNDHPTKITVSGKRPPGAKNKMSVSVTISFEILPTKESPQAEKAPPIDAGKGKPKEAAQPKDVAPGGGHGAAHGGRSGAPGDAHGEADARPSMPPVRLGIMPTYGEPDGEGYEISGVTPGGPADQAGMKDTDRIYKIGDHLIKDVYTYMDALRQYKPGDEIPVIVLRDGKQVTLTIKVAVPKSKEAA